MYEPIKQIPLNPVRTHQVVAATLFLLGMYSPSSFGGVYSESLWVLYGLAFVCLLFPLLFERNGMGSSGLCVNSILLIASLLAATVISPFSEYRWGGLFGFLLLAFLYLVVLRDVTGGKSLQIIFVLANLVNVMLGMAVILGSELVDNFLVRYYSSFYPELLEMMMGFRKPVLSFATHSVAAFFFYLFFFLNFETYKVKKSRVYLIFALCYVGLTFSLFSFSSMALTSFAVFQVLRYSAQRRRKTVMAILVVTILAVGAFVIRYLAELENLATISQAVSLALTSPTSGFLGRFSQVGTLYDTVNYLRSRPFSPVGLSYRGDLFFGDSGLVEYYLRGSIALVITVYAGL